MKKILQVQIFLMMLVLSMVYGHAETVTLYPDDNIQEAVDNHREGTVFHLSAGIYRSQKVSPKRGNQFIGTVNDKGEPITVLNGAKVLSAGWTAVDTYIWKYNENLPIQKEYGVVPEKKPYIEFNKYTNHGVNGNYPACDYSERCNQPENLYRNSNLLKKGASYSALKSGSWYLDYTEDNSNKEKIILKDNAEIYLYDENYPKNIEMGLSRYAFGIDFETGIAASDVVFKNLVVEKYANLYQMGAIGNQMPGEGWLIENCEVRLNNSAGIRLGSKNVVKDNYVHHNGQIGIKGSLEWGYSTKGGKWEEGDDPKTWINSFVYDAIVENNEISHNRLPNSGFNVGQEGGATKFAYTVNLTLRNNYVHDNNGFGLWTDIWNLNTLFQNNRCIYNSHAGIFHEISDAAVIINNEVRGNGWGVDNDGSIFGSQILISGSKNASVTNNTVYVDAGEQGIMVLAEKRGVIKHSDKPFLLDTFYDGQEYEQVAYNINVNNNKVYYLSSDGYSGVHALGRDKDQNGNYISNGYGDEFFSTDNKIVFDENEYHVSDINKKHWSWKNEDSYTSFIVGSGRSWDEFQSFGYENNGILLLDHDLQENYIQNNTERTLYEDAEDRSTQRWSVYDRSRVGATISNIEDNGNRVIQLQGDGTHNGYILGDWSGGKNVWNNRTKKIMKWSMKYNEDFVVYISVETLKGHRYLYYTNSNQSWQWKKGEYLHHGLGLSSSNGTWQTYSRNLEDDLRDLEPDNMITSVNSFLIRGSGLVDNIELKKDSIEPIELISSKDGKKVLMITDRHILTILDTSNKNNSRIIARYELEEDINDIKFSQDTQRVYISLGVNDFQILDIENPHATVPKILSRYSVDGPSIFTVSKDDSKIYLSSYALNFEIINISDVKNPKQVTLLNEAVRPSHPSSFYMLDMVLSSDDKQVYLRDSVGAVYVIDIADISNPRLIQSIGDF